MAQYASQTSVSAEKSCAEIERTYGATGFAYAWDQSHAMIAFNADNRQLPSIPSTRALPAGSDK